MSQPKTIRFSDEQLAMIAHHFGDIPLSEAVHAALAQVIVNYATPGSMGHYLRMKQGAIVIDVANGRAKVARWKMAGGSGWALEYATNWEKLEKTAAKEVNKIGSITVSGQYDIPEALAEKAVWE